MAVPVRVNNTEKTERLIIHGKKLLRRPWRNVDGIKRLHVLDLIAEHGSTLSTHGNHDIRMALLF